jgi:hypothetical protein
MVKFGTKTLPTVLNVEDLNLELFVERPIIGAKVAFRRIVAKYGADFLIDGIITSNVALEKQELKLLADGTARLLDLEDGSSLVNCLMLSPHFRQSGKPSQALWDARFVEYE